MSTPVTWHSQILLADLQSVPALLDDPNVVDVSRKTEVVLSGEFTGGTSPSAHVVVYFYNPVSESFGRTGITLTLREESNLEIFNPSGLVMGFVVTVQGSPSAFTLHVGSR